MATSKFVICGPDGPTRAKRLQPQEWAAHRQTITDLYVHQDKSLDDLMTIMASKHGLIAKYLSSPPWDAPCLLRICSRRQYTEKLRQWKVHKNLPGKVMRSAVYKLHQNPGRSAFTYMTQPISEQHMTRYQQRHPSLDPEASPAPCKYCHLPFSPRSFLTNRIQRHHHNLIGTLSLKVYLRLLKVVYLTRSRRPYRPTFREI